FWGAGVGCHLLCGWGWGRKWAGGKGWETLPGRVPGRVPGTLRKGFGKGSSNPFDEGAGALSALGRQFVDGEPRQLVAEHSAQGGGHGGLDVAERGLEYVRLFPQSVVADESAHEDLFGVLVYDHVPVRVEAFQGGGDPGTGHAVGES